MIEGEYLSVLKRLSEEPEGVLGSENFDVPQKRARQVLTYFIGIGMVRGRLERGSDKIRFWITRQGREALEDDSQQSLE